MVGGRTERETGSAVPAHALSGFELGREFPCPERCDSRLPGLREQRSHERHDVRASFGPSGVRSTEKLRCTARMTGQRGMTTDGVKQIELPDPVIDLASEPQRLLEQWPGRSKLTSEQR